MKKETGKNIVPKIEIALPLIFIILAIFTLFQGSGMSKREGAILKLGSFIILIFAIWILYDLYKHKNIIHAYFPNFRKLVIIIIAIIFLIILLPILGYVLSIIIFSVFSMYITGYNKLLKSIVYSTTMALVLYFIFGILLNISLPIGILKI